MKKINILVLSILVLISQDAISQFVDDFNDGNYFGWFTQSTEGSWQVENGELHNSYLYGDTMNNMIISPVGAVTNFTFECKIAAKDGIGGVESTGIIRSFPMNHWIIFQIYHNTDTDLDVVYMDGGPDYIELYSSTITLGTDWHTMKLQVSGTAPNLTVTAWWDGGLYWTGDITVSDAFAQGHTGLFAFGDSVSMWFDDVSITYDSYVGSKEIKSTIPSYNLLSQSMPNPFSLQTIIKYTVPTTSNIQLNIYNNNGKLVKTLLNEKKTAGEYEIIWDGRNAQGNRVASGNYYYQLITNKHKKAKKLIFLK